MTIFYISLTFLFSILGIIWIFLSIYKQFRPHSIDRNKDPFALVPIWTLFSPRPMKNCCLLAYREKKQDGSTSDIIIVNYFSPRWYYGLWYGQRRDIKFILGVRKQLLKHRKNKHLFLTSGTFNVMKSYVMNYNKPSNDRQLLYILKGGYNLSKKDKLLFVTNIKKK